MKRPGTNISVVIADDHEIFRDGLKLMLSKAENITVVGEASNGKELLQAADRCSPDVVITDIKMPVMDGVEATRHIMEHHPEIGIIALSMFDEEQLILEMLEAGALGYLLKNSDKTELVRAIDCVCRHEPYYCQHTSGKMAKMIAHSRHQSRIREKEAEFSDREKEIINLICQEYTNKQIGEKLYLSTRTVEGYRIKILEKMNAKNTVGIVITAMKLGLFKPQESE